MYLNGIDSDNFTVCFAIKKNVHRPTVDIPILSSIYQYAKADFTGLRNTFSDILWDSLMSCKDIDASTATFQDLVLTVVDQRVPKLNLRGQL